MAETTLELLKRFLDSEEESDSVGLLPSDIYSRISSYAQKLKRSSGPGYSEGVNRLISRQLEMIGSMSERLLHLRTAKASDHEGWSRLLPEEKYVASMKRGFDRRFQEFLLALKSGRQSYLEFARKNESGRLVTIRIVKKVNEMVGMDMKRYGPFEADDLASIPAAVAEALITSGDASEVPIPGEG